MSCGMPATPSNGVLGTSSGTLFGDTVRFTCNSGYSTNGSLTKLTCTFSSTSNTVQWTGPTCSGKCYRSSQYATGVLFWESALNVYNSLIMGRLSTDMSCVFL